MAENLSVEQNNERFTEYPYDIHETWWNDLQKRKMAAMAARIRPGEVVLDVGCNSGYLHEFVPTGCVVHGVDLSPSLVAKASQRYASAQVAAVEHLPFADKSVDVVVMAGVIEYPFDPQVALRECARVAKRIVIVEACHENGIWGAHRIPIHSHMVRSYNEYTLREEVGTIGTVTHHEVIEGHGSGQHRIVEVDLQPVHFSNMDVGADVGRDGGAA